MISQVLQDRRAIRNYEDTEIPNEMIEKLLEAATWAPNDRMREPWNFFVIKGEAKKRYEKIAEEYLIERFPTKPKLIESSLEVVKSTPLLIVVAADQMPDDPDASEDNVFATCCAIHSMWLMAHELDLGFVWRTRGVGLVRDQRLADFVSLPENKKIVGTVFAGFPSEKTEIKMKQRIHYTEKTKWL